MSTPAAAPPPPPSSARSSRPSGARWWPTAAVTVGAALAAVATWVAWLGWESGYRTDPLTGSVSGPYSGAQVVACVLTLAVVAVVAGWWAPPWFVAPAVTLGFTTAWTVDAAAQDESGLFAVGAMMLLVGLGATSALVCTVAWLVGRRHRQRRGVRVPAH